MRQAKKWRGEPAEELCEQSTPAASAKLLGSNPQKSLRRFRHFFPGATEIGECSDLVFKRF
jgi:hypothetical protein